MRVLSIDAAGELAECEDGAGRREVVMTGVVGDVVAGDVLLVHAGTALLRLGAGEEGA
ncbi:MAG: HypC/HybG/HupF family hydrogenase formation chaperone [Gemmatimonadetes bacterium]|nr:HypC/HybG/HupF family hydrogenase formation chaperone [Gemmatimonadota bacterium]